MKSPRQITDYRLLFHDTGDQLFRMEWPPTRESFIDAFIKPYAGSAVDAYCFCVNIAGTTMFYDSKAGEMYGRDTAVFRGSSALRQHEIIKQLCAAGNDPPRLAVEGAREMGMDCFLRLRMNDLHDKLYVSHHLDKPSSLPKAWTAEPCYYMSQFKRRHPELLLGDPYASLPENSYEQYEAYAYNYALGPVREMFYSIAEEILMRYKPDGLQLDFLRFPFFFKRHEAYAQRHLLTGLLRKISKRVKDAEKDNHRRIYLIADIPETIESGLRAGIDIPAWLREGLLDMVTISRGYYPFSSPWNEVASLAKECGIPSFACFNYGKCSGWSDPGNERESGLRTLRAAVYRALNSEVQGVFLFNYFYECPQYDHWLGRRTIGFDFTHELVNMEKLAKTAKTYELANAFEAYSPVSNAHSHTAWKGQVPLTIGPGEGHSIAFDMPAQPDITGAQLWLQLIDPHFDDDIEFRWNGRVIDPDLSAWKGLRLFDRFEYNFSLAPEQICKGENRLEIHLKSRDPRLEPFITLKSGYLTVAVKE